jgi:hypothetical protein
MSGLDSEVRPCCHCDWRCTDALLGQKQDLVTAVLKQAGLYYSYGKEEMKIRSIRFWIRRCFGDLYPVSAHSSEYFILLFAPPYKLI